MRTRLFTLFLLCIWQVFPMQAQELLSEISARSAAVDEPFTVVYTLKNLNTRKLYVPDFGVLEVRSGPSQSSSTTHINGVVRSELSYIYTLSAPRPGTYTIPAAYTEYRGRKIYSKPLQIVVKGAASSARREDPATRSESRGAAPEMYLRVESSHGKVYLGQPVEISYNLYAEAVGTYSFFNENLPRPENALIRLKKEMQEAKKFEPAVYQGKKMQKLTLLKFIVQPVAVGELSIPAPSLGVQYEKEQNNTGNAAPEDLFEMFFGGFMNNPAPLRRLLRGNALRIPVLSLPGTGIPEGFRGAIGEYSVSASVPDLDIHAGKSIAYTIRVKGTGNINLLSELPLHMPEDWDVYGPQVQRNVDDSTTIPAGEISFVYSLIPRKEGKTSIPVQHFAFFNPREGRYEVLATDSIPVNVLPPVDANRVEGTAVSSAGNEMEALHGISWFVLLWICIGLLLVAVLVFLFMERRRRRKITRTGRAGFREKLVALQQLPEEDIYRELEKWLVAWAKERLNVDDVYTNPDLEHRFREQGLDAGRAALWIQIRKACNDARYAPQASGDAHKWIEKAKQLSDY